jgi:hypothetical protein
MAQVRERCRGTVCRRHSCSLRCNQSTEHQRNPGPTALVSPPRNPLSVYILSLFFFPHPPVFCQLSTSSYKVPPEEFLTPFMLHTFPCFSTFAPLINSYSIDASRASGLPCVLVSCKCDTPPPVRQLEPGTLSQLGGTFGSVDTRQTSASKPQTQKQCISIVLRAILTRSRGE